MYLSNLKTLLKIKEEIKHIQIFKAAATIDDVLEMIDIKIKIALSEKDTIIDDRGNKIHWGS